MCFSVNVNLVKEELESRYGATLIDHDKYRPSYYYNAFSFPEIPAVCSATPGKIQMLKWGLIPSWTPGIEDANEIRLKTFNARAESIANKPSFSSSFKSKRCVIPVRGFYEWQHKAKEKIPWYIYSTEGEILSIAGLYDEWVENNTGELHRTCSIITTSANDLMAEIHNSAKRMPVILDKKGEIKWIDQGSSAYDLSGLLVPCPSTNLKAHTISPLVNARNANRNIPELILPYTYPADNLLF